MAAAADRAQDSVPLRIWLGFGILALAFHLLFFLAAPSWILAPAVPKRMEVAPIDPSQLEEIRKKWAANQALLLSKNQKESEEAPRDARYMSDRNIKVEKEQRARNADPVPQEGAKNAGPKTEAQTAAPKRKQVKLGSLGIPILPKKPQSATEARDAAGSPGADQSINEDELPVGSENLLNSERSVYYSFHARIYEAIAPIWRSQVLDIGRRNKFTAGDHVTHVEVVFDTHGDLAEVNLLKSSGYPALDQVATSVWYKVKRFPNPPRGLLDAQNQIRIQYSFMLQLTEDMLRFADPVRIQ